MEPVSCLLKRVDATSDHSFEDKPKRVAQDRGSDVDSAHAQCELDNFDPADLSDFYQGATKKLS